MSIIVLQERDKRGGDGGNLLRSHVHKIYFGGRNDWVVVILTALHDLADEGTVLAQRSITLSDD